MFCNVYVLCRLPVRAQTIASGFLPTMGNSRMHLDCGVGDYLSTSLCSSPSHHPPPHSYEAPPATPLAQDSLVVELTGGGKSSHSHSHSSPLPLDSSDATSSPASQSSRPLPSQSSRPSPSQSSRPSPSQSSRPSPSHSSRRRRRRVSIVRRRLSPSPSKRFSAPSSTESPKDGCARSNSRAGRFSTEPIQPTSTFPSASHSVSSVIRRHLHSSISEASPRLDARGQSTPYAPRLFRSSFQTLISVFSSWFFGHYDCTIVSTILMLTSILYWHHAINGWRRNVDMCAAIFTVLYHVYKAYMYATALVFCVYFIMFLILTFIYHTARQCKEQGDKRTSAYLHMYGMHCFGNVCNFVFYAATCSV